MAAKCFFLRALAAVGCLASTTLTIDEAQREHVSGDVAYKRLYYRRNLVLLETALNETHVGDAVSDVNEDFAGLRRNVSRLLDEGETNWRRIQDVVRPFLARVNASEPRFVPAFRQAARRTEEPDATKLSAVDPVSSWDYIYDLVQTVATNATAHSADADADTNAALMTKLDKADGVLATSVANEEFAVSSRKVAKFVAEITKALPEFKARASELTKARHARLRATMTSTTTTAETAGDGGVTTASSSGAGFSTGSSIATVDTAASGSGATAASGAPSVSTPAPSKTSAAAGSITTSTTTFAVVASTISMVIATIGPV